MPAPEVEPDYYVKRHYAYAPQVDGIIPDEEPGKYGHANPITLATPYDSSNLITSLVYDSNNSTVNISNNALHAPAIDIDVPCELLPSSQPGHYHLYIHKEMPWLQYYSMLLAMVGAGVVEKGFVQAASQRKYTALRHIGQPKPGIVHRGKEILIENAQLRHKNFLLEQHVQKLQQENEKLQQQLSEEHALAG